MTRFILIDPAHANCLIGGHGGSACSDAACQKPRIYELYDTALSTPYTSGTTYHQTMRLKAQHDKENPEL
jgi:hypothetical protein